jgi:asparagine synthase (glutamine-hydrolysing)
MAGQSGPGVPACADHPSGCVIFDGVLYNRAELRASLADPPHHAVDDATLILHAYRRWGEDVLRRIKGIFALLVFDKDQDTLLCARGPLGVYPLFYAGAGQEVLVSTSIPALLSHPGVSGELNRAVLADHLSHHWSSPGETFFTAVNRVPQGHALKFGRAGREVLCYLRLAPSAGAVAWVGEGELGRFDELLDQAVHRCLAHGPAGIFLSGGLDSVSVAAVAADICRRRGLPVPHALSLAFPGPECDEEEIQRGVAAGLGLPQVLMPFGEAVGPDGLLGSALGLCETWPAPMLNPWRWAYYRLATEGKRQGCQVILTGGGGDEALTVNPDYAADLIRRLDVAGAYRLLACLLRSYRTPRPAMLRFLLWNSGVRPLLALHARRLLRAAAPGLLRALWRQRGNRSRPGWVAPGAALRRQLDQRLEERVEARTREPDPSGPHGYYMRHVSSNYIHPLVSMEQEDDFEAGRRLGLRVLQPYWDAELLEFLYRIPPDLLLRGGREKGLVRQTLARRFPRLGFDSQRKVSAATFFQSLLLQEGPRAWRKMGGAPALAGLGIIDGKRIDSVLAESFSSKQIRTVHRIWEVLSLEAWARPRV